MTAENLDTLVKDLFKMGRIDLACKVMNSDEFYDSHFNAEIDAPDSIPAMFHEALFDGEQAEIDAIVNSKGFDPNGIRRPCTSKEYNRTFFTDIVCCVGNREEEWVDDYCVELVRRLKKMGGTNTKEAICEAKEKIAIHTKVHLPVEIYERLLAALEE